MSSQGQYRLAVFKATSLDSLFAAASVSPTMVKSVRRSIIDRPVTLDDDDGHRHLAVVRFLEAVGWLEAGIVMSYFDESAADEPALRFLEHAEVLATTRDDSWEPSLPEFRDAMLDAQLADDDHLDYLRLTHFASESAWNARLETLRTFTQLIEARSDAKVSDQVMDGVVWALDAPEWMGCAGSPSRWRREWKHSARYVGSVRLSPYFANRLSTRLLALAQYRDRIAAAAAYLTDDVAAATSFRLARTLDEAALHRQGIVTWRDPEETLLLSDLAAEPRDWQSTTERPQATGDDVPPN